MNEGSAGVKNRESGLLERQARILSSIKRHLPALEECYGAEDNPCGGEDGFYRFYHGSFKVYLLQAKTRKIVDLFVKIGEEAGVDSLNETFVRIIDNGLGLKFSPECNLDWGNQERPILEAFFHAREMLSLSIKYGRSLSGPAGILPSGWAAVLYLYNSR